MNNITDDGMLEMFKAFGARVCRIVLYRKIRMRMVNSGGMGGMFDIMMTCFLTWRRRGLDMHQKILEVLVCT